MTILIHFIIILFSLFSLLCFTFTSAHIIPKFPSSVVSPELQQTSVSVPNGLYRTKFFTQILDHFNYNPQSYQTFQQRYLINDTYWGGAKKKAPIFVYTGNEGDIEWFTLNTGFMFEIAPYFNALLVFIEHRYYGKSIPFGGNDEVANRNSSTLGYMSSTQALADYATLIIDLKKNLSAIDSPVVVFGGSYGGMLAAWFRLKYPHVAIGALASSAPILQFLDLVSPYTFTNIVTQDYKSESENCYKVIKESWKEIEDTANAPGGIEQLHKSFKICKNNTITADALKGWLQTALMYTAMTDYPTPTNFLTPLPAYPVKKMCEAIDSISTAGNESLTKMYAVANIFYNYTGTVTCFDFGNDSDDSIDQGGWNWQSCTEMIMPLGGNNEESIFPAQKWELEDTLSYCKHEYHIVPRPHWITTEFGGQDIGRVLKRFGSNIIFFNGLRDPWSGGGVLKNISKSLIAIVATEGAHHVDLRFSTKGDPKWLKNVRKQEVKIIESWISQYYQDLLLQG
ncbi:lysosomal Pro-X carboxypeptidase-like [Trifolium pratense]|uniref:lysosomal Pro-X carboxypeptidase-like n=1 Tax=Trifolium pratense TaxID=57577 RepID=UPI001E6913A6|nr:lysosomal Pro-X carboxypeptidase-like [Trifolium pratense]